VSGILDYHHMSSQQSSAAYNGPTDSRERIIISAFFVFSFVLALSTKYREIGDIGLDTTQAYRPTQTVPQYSYLAIREHLSVATINLEP
jgi:hypothetical protein